MPQEQFAFTGRSNKISNILFSKAYISRAFTPNKQNIALSSNCKEYIAIWDTGATGSVITPRVVKECGLKTIGLSIRNTASGTEMANDYLVNLWLPNRMLIYNLRVAQMKIVGGVDILIGMDIINKGDLAISNLNGKTVFSFRMPSLECIDYVEKIQKIQTRKSIKKFKQPLSS